MLKCDEPRMQMTRTKNLFCFIPTGIPAAFSYACLYNFLDLPAGIVPVTKETQEDQTMLMNGSYDFNDLVCRLVKKVTRSGFLLL